MDWLWLALAWTAIAVTAAPIAVGLGWAVIKDMVLPRLVSRLAIEDIAEAVMRCHPEGPEEWTFMAETEAWYQGRSVEQGTWRRVRRAIRRRLQRR